MASFRCYDNSDVIATLIMTNFHLYLVHLWWQFFQMFVYGRSLCSNLAGINPEKLYRGTFICQYGLCCYIAWPPFLFDCFVKIWATFKNFLGKWFTSPPPSGRKLPVRLWAWVMIQILVLPPTFCVSQRPKAHFHFDQSLFFSCLVQRWWS